MGHSHIPKLKVTFPSEVLGSSDKRPCRKLTFHYVLTRQDSSFSTRAHLNFQAFALHDMKMAAQEGRHIGQKMTDYFTYSSSY